jgi:hypothetical protein
LVLAFCGLSSSAQAQQPVPVEELGKSFQLVGNLNVPLGQVVTVEGVVVEGPFKGFEGGPNLRVQRIGGRYIQENIQLVLQPAFQDWGDELPKLELGKTYQMTGFETGGFVGHPPTARNKKGVMIQTTTHYFRLQFAVSEAKVIKPIAYAPAMFSGEKALLGGTAKTIDGSAAMVGKDWTVFVKRGTAWEKDVEGKEIECHGRYNPDATWRDHPQGGKANFDLLDGVWRLVRLEDQVGKRVALRGIAMSLNGEWWLEYRGTRVHVDGMANLPGWTIDMHARAVSIEGKLERAKLPRIDQISEKPDRDLEESFVVREASWKALPGLLFPERAVEKE